MVAGEHPAVSAFRRYIQIKTVHPTPDYVGAVDFLRKEAQDAGLLFRTHECVPGKPFAIMTWEGSQPELPSLMLNSHIDVVPVEADKWTYDPFSAHKDGQGRIYGRGTQDMKCVGIQYLYAVRQMKDEGRRFPRTIHILWTPDEEIGGADGMALFVGTDVFRSLNVAMALDEGLANPGDKFIVFVGERGPWWLKITSRGPPGHGSSFIKDTATYKLHRVLDRFLRHRDEQEAALESTPGARIGDVTSVNITMLDAGQQHNVIPACVDMRLPPTVAPQDFERMVSSWMEDGVTYEWVVSTPVNVSADTSDGNPYWAAFLGACEAADAPLERPAIFPAGTDARFIRPLGVPMLGFTPICNTPVLLHDHDEYLSEDMFLRGLRIYTHIILALASVP